MEGWMRNQKRGLAEVVSIDAWHERFGEKCSRADLHANVTFMTARLGGESQSQVRFRLSIKRAEIVAVIPENENLGVDKRSVAQGDSDLKASRSGSVAKSGKAKAGLRVAAGISSKGTSGSASTSLEAEAGLEAKDKITYSETVELMLVRASKTPDGHYRWAIEPQSEFMKVLDGRPWDGMKAPRLTLIDRRKNRSDGIEPVVRIEIRCLREDLVIENIEVKDTSVWNKLSGAYRFKNKLAAAEALIRDMLAKEGLAVGEISDKFAAITLASETAEPVGAKKPKATGR